MGKFMGKFAFCIVKICLVAQINLVCGCGLMSRDTDPGAAGADAAAGEKAAAEWQGDPVPYKTEIVVDGPKYLKDKMRGVSQLAQLEKEAPDSVLALERRAREDQETAIRLLQSQCYYDGEASFSMDDKVKPVLVTLKLVAGPRYKVGHALVHYVPKPVIPEGFRNRFRETGFWGLQKEALPPPSFPETVPGVEAGKPIVADDMLAAVSAIPDNLRKTGYPLAKVEKTVYTLDKPGHLLNADVTINPGPAAVMGDIVISGDKTVSREYLRRLVPWRRGREPWDDNLLEDYANDLRSLGLFNRVEAKADAGDLKTGAAGEYEGAVVLPANISLVEGPARSVSFSARYDSDTGFGVEGAWEHRNLFGNGEKLYLDAPISQEERGLKAYFEKPAFLDRNQRLLIEGAALWENTDAYDRRFARGSLGLDRKLARN